MSRHGYYYTESYEEQQLANLWRGAVATSIRGKRGQSFLKELAVTMDAMPVKELIKDELVTENGQCCAIGAICKARNIDVSSIEIDDPEEVGNAVGISRSMAAEIEYQNDEADSLVYINGKYIEETPAQRWTRMREWVNENLLENNHGNV